MEIFLVQVWRPKKRVRVGQKCQSGELNMGRLSALFCMSSMCSPSLAAHEESMQTKTFCLLPADMKMAQNERKVYHFEAAPFVIIV